MIADSQLACLVTMRAEKHKSNTLNKSTVGIMICWYAKRAIFVSPPEHKVQLNQKPPSGMVKITMGGLSQQREEREATAKPSQAVVSVYMYISMLVFRKGCTCLLVVWLIYHRVCLLFYHFTCLLHCITLHTTIIIDSRKGPELASNKTYVTHTLR